MALQDLIQRTREDTGSEGPRGKEPPSLWPEIVGGIPGVMPITEDESFKINKMRELIKRMQGSPYYLEEMRTKTDVFRWSDRNNKHDKERHEMLLDHLAESAPCAPPELFAENLLEGRNLGGIDLTLQPGKRRRTVSYEETRLKALEEHEGKAPTGQAGEEETVDRVEDPEDDDEFAADYAKDYYESDGDNDNSGDDEPVF